MRIIGGRWKGHYLVSFKADHIRPTTDRVKETLFNILQMHIEGARVLDLFCGTGNLGIEALSRGAAHVTFVEKSNKSLKITRENLEKLKVPREEYDIVAKDVLSFLKNYDGEPYDIIFADPPFTEKMAHEVMEAADGSKVFSPEPGHTLLAIESAGRERMDDQYPNLERYNHREYGDKILSLFRKK